MADVSLLFFTNSHCSAGVPGSALLLTAPLAALSSGTKTSQTSTADMSLNDRSFPLHLPGLQATAWLTHTASDIFSNIQIVNSLPLLGFEGFLSKNTPNF